MNLNKKMLLSYISILFIGLISVFLTLITPSEASSAFFMGYSKERFVILGSQVFLFLILVSLFIFLLRGQFGSSFIQNINKFLNNQANYFVIRNCLIGVAIFLSFAFFYVTIFVPQALSAITGWLAYIGWVVFALFVKFIMPPSDRQPDQKRPLFPSWKNLSTQQKRITFALLFIGLIYFCIFIPVNLKNTATPQVLTRDESIQYQVVMKMLSHQESVRFTFYRLFSYGEYIYGFPFYGLSALLLIPVKLFFKASFSDQTQLNMLILRQLVCVLPSALSAFLFTYLATRFKKWWTSIGVFLILLTLPGMVWYITRFWHPDALNLLFIAITLYYLDRDKLEFGGNFYYAAIACGLSIATRLFGLFFFLAIAGLLTAGLIKKLLTFKKAVITGVLFCLLMAGTILIANSYLFNPGEFSAAKSIFERQQVQISQGIDEPDPEGVYRMGFDAWWPFMTRYYGAGITLGILGASAIAGMFGGTRKHYYRILFAWLLVMGIYLIYFVMVKSYWYLLPFLIPLYSASLAIPDNFDELKEKVFINRGAKIGIKILIYTLIGGIGAHQLLLNIQWILAQHIFA